MQPMVTDRVAWSVYNNNNNNTRIYNAHIYSSIKHESEVLPSVCQSVTVVSCKNSWTDRDAVWVVDLGWPKEPWCIRRGCTVAPPGKYDWTVHVQRRCGLLSNYLTTCIIVVVRVAQKEQCRFHQESGGGWRNLRPVGDFSWLVVNEFFFGVLTLLDGWQEGHPFQPVNTRANYPERFFNRTGGGREL